MPDLRYTEVDAECDQLATVELSRQHARCNVRDNVSYSVEQKICLTSVFEEVYEKVRTLVLKISEFTCRLCSLWLVLPLPRTLFITRELCVTKKTVIDWSSFSREVCQFWLEEGSEVLGGEDVVVEIDEAKIGHRRYKKSNTPCVYCRNTL